MGGKSKARQIVESELREAAQVALGAVTGRYLKAFDRRAHGYALLGHTNEEIAELIGVSASTFDDWLVANPSLRDALRRARYDDNVRVVQALHRAARGYKHRETKLNVVDGELIKTDVIKAYPPNPVAATLILTNRAGQHWKDRRVSDVNVGVNLASLIEGLHGAGAKVIEGTATTADKPKDEA